MCGIFGILHHENKQIDQSFLSGLEGSLARRGPDNQGVEEFLIDSKKLKFGHTRLSILDLEKSGNQPMSSHSDRFSIIYNGEIYNHLKLRKKVEKKVRVIWRGTSDTETLLEMFENFPISKVLNEVRGMFSFILYDKKERKLYIARDQAGEKPLYLSTSKGFIGFASDLDPLKKVVGFNKSLDFEAVEDFLKLNYIPTPKTIYKNSFKLPPANCLILNLNFYQFKSCDSFDEFVDSKGVSCYNWIDEKEGLEMGEEIRGLDEQSLVLKLEEVLSESVRSQQISDVPLGAFLSGGIDSSLIVSLMKKVRQEETKTFTVGFNFLEYDESEHAQKVANHLGTDHTTYRCSENDFFDLIPNLNLAFSEPFADSSQLPTMLVSRMAKQQVKVVLSGDAGDELFGGYNRYLLANKYYKYFRFTPFILRSNLSRLFKLLPSSLAMGLINTIISTDFSGNKENNLSKILNKALYIKDKKSFYTSMINEWTKEDKIMDFKEEVNNYHFLECFDSKKETKLEETMMKADFNSYLPDDILCKVDRSSMFYSLETRAPFLNREVIDFAFNLPLNMKIRNGESKWILKQLLSKYLPRELFDRPKQGFGIPVSKWMRGELKDWVNETLSDEALNQHNLFNKSVVSKVKEDHFKGLSNNEHKLWSLLQFNQWYDSNK
tara:strand:- start:29880 stop:31865 length:1986 start_codon:yes stop_codon:yes gene_type:complete